MKLPKFSLSPNPQSETPSTALAGFLGPNSKLSLRWLLWAILLFAATVFFVLGLNYNLLARLTQAPELKLPPTLISEPVRLQASTPFTARINDERVEAVQEADNLYTLQFPAESGVYDYRIYGLRQNQLFTVHSHEVLTGTVTQDLEPPQIERFVLSDLYHDPVVEFGFEASEVITLEFNDEMVECVVEDLTYQCRYDFETEGEKNLVVTFTDQAGNTVTEQVQTLYTPLPEISCEGEVPERTRETTLTLQCRLNKEGELFVAGEEINFTPRAEEPEAITLNLVEEGPNTIELKFVDTYDLEDTLTYEVTRDTTAPTAEFTFLDTKKVFQEGTIGVGFTSSEQADVTTRFYPVNNFFETDALARQILESGNFVYEGGEEFTGTIAAGQEVTYATTNNFAMCQILTPTNKNCFSPGMAAIDITLTDELGNQRAYRCNNWITTATAPLDGLEATTCQER